jgi:hypothetical protein
MGKGRFRRLVEKMKDYPCLNCKVVEETKAALSTHSNRKHAKLPEECTDCANLFATKADLEIHSDTCICDISFVVEQFPSDS